MKKRLGHGLPAVAQSCSTTSRMPPIAPPWSTTFPSSPVPARRPVANGRSRRGWSRSWRRRRRCRRRSRSRDRVSSPAGRYLHPTPSGRRSPSLPSSACCRGTRSPVDRRVDDDARAAEDLVHRAAVHGRVRDAATALSGRASLGNSARAGPRALAARAERPSEKWNFTRSAGASLATRCSSRLRRPCSQL